jgi:hypothetical protein
MSVRARPWPVSRRPVSPESKREKSLPTKRVMCLPMLAASEENLGPELPEVLKMLPIQARAMGRWNAARALALALRAQPARTGLRRPMPVAAAVTRQTAMMPAHPVRTQLPLRAGWRPMLSPASHVNRAACAKSTAVTC